MQNKQNIVKNQLVFIFVVGVMMLVALVSAMKSDASTFRWITWISFTLLAVLFLLLIWGLKSVKKIQEKIDMGDVADKEVQKILKTPVYDERQRQFVLKGYQLGFVTIIFLLWIQTVLGRVWSDVVSSDFMIFATLLIGMTVNVTYTNLKGATPYVDRRFGKYGNPVGLVALVFGLLIVTVVLGVTIAVPLTPKEFFVAGGNGTMLLLGLGLCSMAGSILYRLSRDKREADE